MGLTACGKCIKFLVLIFNLLFWLGGIGILSVAVWLRVDYAQYARAHPDLENYYLGTYILMAAGGLMTFVGFFGCCGAYRESPCMLGFFFTLLLMIFAAEIAAGVWAYYHKNDLPTIVNAALETTVKHHYSTDPLQMEAVDIIQKELHCCGANSYKDWSSSSYQPRNSGGHNDIGVAGDHGYFKVPLSCCSSPSESICKSAVTKVTMHAATADYIYPKGCSPLLYKFIDEILDIVAGVGIGIAIIELLGMIFSMILCCAIRREDYYK